MKTIDDDDTLLRAGWIIRHSQAATLCDIMASRSTASLQMSRGLAIARAIAARFQSMPAAERSRCTVLVTTIALAGHALMTGLLPSAARPLPAFSTLSLLGAGLAIGIVTRRPRS